MEKTRISVRSELWRRTDEILHFLWDPIGVRGIPQARDEYHGYVWHVCELLRGGKGEEDLVAFLGSARQEAMGLRPDEGRDREVALALLDWGDFLEVADGRLTEGDFWIRLEFRICHELAGFEDMRALGLWCDGIHPESFAIDGSEAVIEGHAWIGYGPGQQERWHFRLVLPEPVEDRSQIEWDQLLPSLDLTHWLRPNPDLKTLEILPGLAEPDAA